jgi:hypothetical protein
MYHQASIVESQCYSRYLPGTGDGQVRTVKMEGSAWSKATVLTGQNFFRSYLRHITQVRVGKQVCQWSLKWWYALVRKH